MKAVGIGLMVLAITLLLGVGCRTAGGKGMCSKCGMPPECCMCVPSK